MPRELPLWFAEAVLFPEASRGRRARSTAQHPDHHEGLTTMAKKPTTTDAGGATVLDLRLERTHAAAGQGARKDGAA